MAGRKSLVSAAHHAWEDMGSRERAIDVGAARAREMRARVSSELRSARLTAGLSQLDVASALGLSRSQYSRLERGLAPLDLEVLSLAFAVLGMDLTARAYPSGDAIRDAASQALLERLHRRCYPSIRWRTEVPLPMAGDLRAWDATGVAPAFGFAVEAETRLRDLQAQERRWSLKQRDGGFERLIVLVADTRANREVVRLHADWVANRFPVPGRRALELLAAGIDPGGDSLILL